MFGRSVLHRAGGAAFVVSGRYRRGVELRATGDGQTVVEVGAPTSCPAGHELRAGTMLAGYSSPDPDTHGPCRTITCRACWTVWYDGWGWR